MSLATLRSPDTGASVVESGQDWSVIAANALDEPMYATPALSGGHIYIRTEEALYRFGTN